MIHNSQFQNDDNHQSRSNQDNRENEMLRLLVESLQEDGNKIEGGQKESCRLAETLLLDASEEAFSDNQAPFSTTMATTSGSSVLSNSSQDSDDNSLGNLRIKIPVENQDEERYSRKRDNEGEQSPIFGEDEPKENTIAGVTSLHVDASRQDSTNKIEPVSQHPQSQENRSRRNPLSRRVVSMADRSISFSPFVTVFDPPDANYYSTDDDTSSSQDDDDEWEDSAPSLNNDTTLASTVATVTTTTATTTDTGPQAIEKDYERTAEVHDTENIQSCDISSVQCLSESLDHNGGNKDVIDPNNADDSQLCGAWSVQSLGKDAAERRSSLDLSGSSEKKGVDLENVEDRQTIFSANSSEKSLEEDLEEGRLYLDLVREEMLAIDSNISNGLDPLCCNDSSTIYMEEQLQDCAQTLPTQERLLRNDAASISENVSKSTHGANQGMMAELAGVAKKKSISYSLVFQLGLALGLGLIAAGCALHFLRQSGWGIS